jgi:hypothetical protein
VSRTSVVARVSSLLLGPAPLPDSCQGATCCGGMRICSPQQFANASLRETVGCKLELAAAAGGGEYISSLDLDDSYAPNYLTEMVLSMKVGARVGPHMDIVRFLGLAHTCSQQRASRAQAGCSHATPARGRRSA